MRNDTRPRNGDTLREILEAQRRGLMEDLQRRLTRIRESTSDAPLVRETGDGDPCALDARLVDIATATLRRIDAAIERLREGMYGRCRRCGSAIAQSRLRAMPFAVCCRACEAIREREDGSRRRPARQRPWSEGYDRVDPSAEDHL